MTIYYVSTIGNDNANGTSDMPFRTIQHALTGIDLDPGDEIVVRPGTYEEGLFFNQGGSAAGTITLRSEVKGEALIRPSSESYNAINVNASYVTIDGFDIENRNGGDGIEANGVHHIKILHNTIHGFGESGVQFNYSEFMLVEGNNIYANADAGWFSGISLYQNRNVTGDTVTEGFRSIVRNNITHDNVTRSGTHTDGNGIIIDDFQSTQTSGFPSYTYPTLVEGNIAYGNGGKGIQVAWSDHVLVIGNTAYHNNTDFANDGTWRGEISNAQSSNNTFVNNIAVVDPTVNIDNRAIDNTSYGGYVNENVIWKNNITFNGTPGEYSIRNDGGNNIPSLSDGNLLGVNPLFVDAANWNFNLLPNSPGIDAGSSEYPLPEFDNDGDWRVVTIVDIGAQESGTAPSNPDPDPEPSPDTFSIWDDTARPETLAEGDTSSVELGLAFTADVDGMIEALSVFRNPGNDAVMPATLWSADGAVLATVTFADTAAGGWQQVLLDTPVAVEAGEAYVVSYHAPQGRYSVTQGFFEDPTDYGPISVGADAGVFQYGSASAFPEQSYQGSNYWIDLVLTQDAVVPDPEPPDPEPISPFSIWDDTARPETLAEGDTSSVELGLAFTADVDGMIEALSVFRNPGNDAVMPATLWSADGAVLATVTFADTAAGGWQQVLLDTPVAVEAGEAYVVSYHAPQGRYSVTQGFFEDPTDYGPISVGADAGVFQYGSASAFPEQSYQGSNYWIDVVLIETAASASAAAAIAHSLFAEDEFIFTAPQPEGIGAVTQDSADWDAFEPLSDFGAMGGFADQFLG